jgi:hypothetical protein
MPSKDKTSLVMSEPVRELLKDLSEVLGLSMSATIDVALVGLAQRIGLRSSAERRLENGRRRPGSAGAPGEETPPTTQRPTPRPRRKPPKQK